MKLSIFNYHYYREEVYSGGIFPVNEKLFRKQLSYLACNYTFISQNDLVKLIISGVEDDKNYCLITFDDGLAEQMSAFSVLKELGIPAIFYVSSDPLKNKKCVDVHKVHHIRSLISDKELYLELDKMFKISTFQFDQKMLKSQYKYDDELSRIVKYFINFIINTEQRKCFVDNIFDTLIDDESAFAESLYMSKEDVLIISDAGMFGTHSASHQPLATLSKSKIEYDIVESIKYFNSIGIQNIQSISYPYGGTSAVNSDVISISKKLGLSFGLTMYRGNNIGKEIFNSNFELKRNSCSDIIIS